MKITCISDLHGYYPYLGNGDLLLIAGDITRTDRLFEWAGFFSVLKKQKYRKKILIGGNHDNFLEKGFPKTQEEADQLKEIQDFLESAEDLEYLCDSGTEFEGFKIWGSPWTKSFEGMNPKCKAFTVDTEEELEEKWKLIPNDTHILITHCPPYGIFDYVRDEWSGTFEETGSIALRNIAMSLPKLKLHVFGHIHEWGGKVADIIATKFVNVSHVNEHYKAINAPVEIELD